MTEGTLKKSKKGFTVELPTKKGTSNFPIPAAAYYFRPEDATDGMTVEVERDAKNLITKVTIPGKPEVAPAGPPTQPNRSAQRHRGGPRQHGAQRQPRQGQAQPTALRGLTKAGPEVLELPFHNPYTFIPFPESAPAHRKPTLLTADELKNETHRLSGVLRLEMRTETPLLSCSPKPIQEEKNGHQTFPALTIGSDVIVPATGVRGALRTLLTILTGGTLGHLDEHAYLCQGRDTQLGPRGPNSLPNTPEHVFLAKVVQPGSSFRSGRIRLGKTQLVKLDALEHANRGQRLRRGVKESAMWIGLDGKGQPTTTISYRQTNATPWQLKVSGRPINLRGKREGAFLAGSQEIDLPPEMWAAYSSRNAHGDRPELRAGDLVSLEPASPSQKTIAQASDVKSLQWSRWGKTGQALKDQIPPHVLPDYTREDGQVDAVTDLFGQVSPRRHDTPAFAARIRPDNLVFREVASKAKKNQVTLAPMMQPHAGCVAFYRQNASPDHISESDQLRGYKVYRVQAPGEEKPWLYKTQGVYGDQGQRLPDQQAVNKTCELIPEGETGQLNIAFRGLTKGELALLLQACNVPWRLGGGKPLGLGLCNVRVKDLIGEFGTRLEVPGWIMQSGENGLQIEGWQSEPEIGDIQHRILMWQASQKPVPKVRYPRAVDDNRNRKSRGGHAWFQRHASPRMVTNRADGLREPGLNPMHIDGPLKQSVESAGGALDLMIPLIAGQILPQFDPEDPLSDLLYGYDAIGADTEDRERPTRRVFLRVEAFDPNRHVRGDEESGGNQGKNATFRKEQRENRQT